MHPNPIKALSRLRCVLAVTLLLAALTGAAYDVTGTVADPDGQPLPQASLRLLAARDSAYVKGAAAGTDGVFRLTGIKTGKYILEASYIGMHTEKLNVTVGRSDLRLDTIRLRDGAIALDDIVVRGTYTPVKVMEDTVEYAAGAYKTQPNAVVEDLLKKLPGVEVGSDGSITANGKTVSKILLNGEEFFSDDPKVASKNLPVDIVEKLQVVDRKSDLARMTGVDDGEDETVINLTVKKGMENGWYGTATAGYGTDNRYKGGFNLNRFWNGNQVSLLGNFNNINEEGFTDSNGNRFRRFGGNRGINTTSALGLNFNVGNGTIFRVGGDLLYSHNNRLNVTRTETQYLFPDSASFTLANDNSRDKGHNFRGDFRIQWKPDSFNTLDVRPNISLNYNNSTSSRASSVWAGRPGIDGGWGRGAQVNGSDYNSAGNGHSLETGARLIYNHSFKERRGRSFSVMLNFNHSRVSENDSTFSATRFFRRLGVLDLDSMYVYDELADNLTTGTTMGGRVSWTEPIGDPARGNYLTLSYRLSYRRNNADKLVYDRPVNWLDSLGNWTALYEPGMTEYMVSYLTDPVFNQTLSNQFRNSYLNQEVRLGYKKVSKTVNLDAGLAFVPQRSESRDLVNSLRDIPTRWVYNFAPFLRYRHKFDKQTSLTMFYNGRSGQPSMTQLQPVADVSNPLSIVVGNPDLDPYFTHQLNLRYQDFDMTSQRSIMVMTDWSAVQNQIVSRTTHDALTGGQTTTYENVNGTWSGRMMMMYSQPLSNKLWRISNHIFANVNHSIGFTNGLRNTNLNYSVNEMFGITFAPDNLSLELRPGYSYQGAHNTVKSAGVKSIHTVRGTFNGTYYTPFGLVLNTELTLSRSYGQAAGFNQNSTLWNATISYQTLRDKSLTFGVTAYDLLGKLSNTSHTFNASSIVDSEYNSLTRYFMATVTWKFNTFKGKTPTAIGADDRGPGGPGGRPGPGGPGGPGPR